MPEATVDVAVAVVDPAEDATAAAGEEPERHYRGAVDLG